MPGLLESCRTLFGTDDLYKVLGIKKKASETEVKRGYHKVSLKVHPDRVTDADKENATQKFQTLGKVYSILSDKEKRAVYDESGEVDEENDIPQDRDWYDYWRILFRKISPEDIKDFEKDYKGSKEEKEDLKEAYLQSEGDMDEIMDSVMCATVDDEVRFTKILKDLIKKKEIPDYPAFTKESKAKKTARKRRGDTEAAEAEEMAREQGLGSGANDLEALIQKRQQSREQQVNSFFADLEAKYAQPKKAKSKKGKK